MEQLSGACPRCGEQLQVPAQLAEFSCMYCGERIRREDFACQNAQPLLEELKQSLPACITDQRGTVRFLFADKFPDRYKSYKKECGERIEPLGSLPQAQHDTLATHVVEAIATWAWEHSKNARAEQALLEDARFAMCLLFVPAAQELAPWQGKPFSQALQKAWLAKYPRQPFSITTYDEIMSGFSRRKYCFITSAVCSWQGKADDCRELTAFRSFRDGWLSGQWDGPALVEEYYRIAPGIVTAIDLTDPDRAYPHIWRTWLKPCYAALQAGDYADCKARYVRMVRRLSRRYLGA